MGLAQGSIVVADDSIVVADVLGVVHPVDSRLRLGGGSPSPR